MTLDLKNNKENGLTTPNEGQTFIHVCIEGVIAGGVVYSIPAGKKLYISGVTMATSNNFDSYLEANSVHYFYIKNVLATILTTGHLMAIIDNSAGVVDLDITFECPGDATNTAVGWMAGWLQ
jgi:hypothetical protein